MKFGKRTVCLLLAALLAAALLGGAPALALETTVVTAAAMPQELRSMAIGGWGFDEANTQTYEVTVSGDLSSASELSFTLPYPAGTDASTWFDSFLTSSNGNRWGQSGEGLVENTADGVKLTLDDVAASYVAVLAWGEHTGGPGGSGGGSSEDPGPGPDGPRGPVIDVTMETPYGALQSEASGYGRAQGFCAVLDGNGHHSGSINAPYPDGYDKNSAGTVFWLEQDGSITKLDATNMDNGFFVMHELDGGVPEHYVLVWQSAGWTHDGAGWRYRGADGRGYGGGWWQIDGKWYLFDNGYMQTGWQQVGGRWYYLGGDGAMRTGWQRIGGKWYYLNGDGSMATGWQKLGGKWYYMNSAGQMQTGWQKLGGKWYYMNGAGQMQTGWRQLGGKWYYMNGAGQMATGWRQLGGVWYFLGGDGAMRTGWQRIGGKWYYFRSSGAMAANETVGGYRLDATGAWVQ